MSHSVIQACNTPEDKNCLQVVSYMLPRESRKNLILLRQHTYPHFTEVTLHAPGEEIGGAGNALRALLRAHDFDAQFEPSQYGDAVKKLTVRHPDTHDTVIRLAKVIGSAAEHEGGIPKNCATEIIDYELDRTQRLPSQAGLIAFNSGPAHHVIERRNPQPHFLVDIYHPFSSVVSLDEFKQPAGLETDRITHIGTENNQASLTITGLLRAADIYAEPQHLGKTHSLLIADAPANIVAGRLSKHDLIPPSIAAEIAMRAHTLNNGFADKLQRPPSTLTYRGK